MPRKTKPISVTLGKLQQRVDARVESGAYTSASEVLRAAIRALDREEAALDSWMRQCVEEALSDPRPDIPAHEVFRQLREHHRLTSGERPEDEAVSNQVPAAGRN